MYEKVLYLDPAERRPRPGIFRLICVHSRSFAAKKRISSKPNGGYSLPYVRLSLVSGFLRIVSEEPYPMYLRWLQRFASKLAPTENREHEPDPGANKAITPAAPVSTTLPTRCLHGFEGLMASMALRARKKRSSRARAADPGAGLYRYHCCSSRVAVSCGSCSLPRRCPVRRVTWSCKRSSVSFGGESTWARTSRRRHSSTRCSVATARASLQACCVSPPCRQASRARS